MYTRARGCFPRERPGGLASRSTKSWSTFNSRYHSSRGAQTVFVLFLNQAFEGASVAELDMQTVSSCQVQP